MNLDLVDGLLFSCINITHHGKSITISDVVGFESGQIRLRPILMTTAVTVLAMLPLVIGIGEGAEQQAPMATVVAFGLLFSTLITLVLIPVVYVMFDNKIEKRRQKKEMKQQMRMQNNSISV